MNDANNGQADMELGILEADYEAWLKEMDNEETYCECCDMDKCECEYYDDDEDLKLERS